MLGTQRPTRTWTYRFIGFALVLGVVGLGVIAGAAQPAAGQADLTLDTLSVADTNETITEDIQTVELETTLDYNHDVPDTDRRLITLEARPEGGTYEQVTFSTEDVVSDAESGSVTLSGDLLQHSAISAADLQPAVAGNTTTEIDVRATLEVQRENGDTVTSTIEDTATLSLHDGTELTAEIGGTGDLTVTTA
jgi:hypothetical protein